MSTGGSQDQNSRTKNNNGGQGQHEINDVDVETRLGSGMRGENGKCLFAFHFTSVEYMNQRLHPFSLV